MIFFGSVLGPLGPQTWAVWVLPSRTEEVVHLLKLKKRPASGTKMEMLSWAYAFWAYSVSSSHWPLNCLQGWSSLFLKDYTCLQLDRSVCQPVSYLWNLRSLIAFLHFSHSLCLLSIQTGSVSVITDFFKKLEVSHAIHRGLSHQTSESTIVPSWRTTCLFLTFAKTIDWIHELHGWLSSWPLMFSLEYIFPFLFCLLVCFNMNRLRIF